MIVGIVDADLIGRKNHRFPNLACEKISSYWKKKGAEVQLLTDYSWDPLSFDHVYVSKVFMDTPVPEWLVDSDKVSLGGTGFYFDEAPDLPYEIEHSMPDYHLYDDWIFERAEEARSQAANEGNDFDQKRYMAQFKEYTDYSIGFLTRGCFRKCAFCVNKKYDRVFKHSPLEEFFDPDRKKICLLDDNFFGYPGWKDLLQQPIDSGKPFKFKQGLDERLLTDEKCEMLFSAKYDGDITFAFDDISDYDLISQKLKMLRRYHTTNHIKFYVLVGFKSADPTDILSAFQRIELLSRYDCVPYLMRYQGPTGAPWRESKYKGLYTALACWANQPRLFRKMTFRQFCEAKQSYIKTEGTLCASMRALTEFEADCPELAQRYFDVNFGKIKED